MVDAERTVRFDYDAAGRLSAERLEEFGTPALVTAYGYGGDGLVSRVTYPSGLQVALDRDPATSEVRSVSAANGTMTFADAISESPPGRSRARAPPAIPTAIRRKSRSPRSSRRDSA